MKCKFIFATLGLAMLLGFNSNQSFAQVRADNSNYVPSNDTTISNEEPIRLGEIEISSSRINRKLKEIPASLNVTNALPLRPLPDGADERSRAGSKRLLKQGLSPTRRVNHYPVPPVQKRRSQPERHFNASVQRQETDRVACRGDGSAHRLGAVSAIPDAALRGGRPVSER